MAGRKRVSDGELRAGGGITPNGVRYRYMVLEIDGAVSPDTLEELCRVLGIPSKRPDGPDGSERATFSKIES